MSRYVVYVNRPNNKAYTHLTTCHSYINRKPIDLSGEWSKEFETFQAAKDFADSTHKKDTRPCKKCIGN
jgi:hypothetical protein